MASKRILINMGMRKNLAMIFCLFMTVVAAAEEPTAQEVLNRALERADAQFEIYSDAQFESSVYSEVRRLDARMEVIDTERERYRQYPVEGALFDELVEKDGRELTSKERKQEAKRREKFIREVNQRVSSGEHPQPERNPSIRFNHELMDRYDVAHAGTEVLRGHDCWILTFHPKEGKLPMRTRMDPALNNSSGRIWIAKEDYGLARVEFAMDKPFKYWGGLLATIRNTEARLEFDRIAPDVWLPLDFDFEFDIEILSLKNIRRHFVKRWSNYSRAAVASTFTPAE